MATDARSTIARYERMKNLRSTFDDVNQEIGDYMVPHKSDITRDTEPGQKTMARVHDATAIDALETLAASMHGTLTNPSQKWFSLPPRQKEHEKLEGVLDWLEALEDAFYAALGDSNFDAEVVDFYKQLAAFGTGAVFMDERQRPEFGFGGFSFTALEFGQYAISEDQDGLVNTVFREFEMERVLAHELWGGDKVEGTSKEEATKRALERPDELLKFLHAVSPRKTYSQRLMNGSLNMPWASCYITLSREPRVLEEGGYRTFPYIVCRWSKKRKSPYGYGPGRTALPDVKTLNELIRLNLGALGKEVDPPLLQRHEAILGDTNLAPASINIVDIDPGVPLSEALQPLESRRHVDRIQLDVQRLQGSIRRVFFNQQLELPDKAQATATEMSIRYELMQRLLGPTLGRLKFEFLNRMIERGLSLMSHAGALPAMPPEVAEVINDVELDVRFEGPLARAQRSHDLVAIQRKNEHLATVLPIHPEAGDIYDFDEEERYFADTAGVPNQIIRERDDVEAIRAERRKAQEKQAQAQALMTAAEGIGKAGPGVKALAEAGQAQGAQPGA